MKLLLHKISDPTPLFSYKRQTLKRVERSSEKIKDDYEGDARALKDVYGGTLVYSSYEDIRKAFAGLNRIESLPVYEFKEPKQSMIGKSYWDYKINFLMPNGTVGEIILIHEYIDTMKNGVLEDGKRKVSGIGHRIYEITRKFDRDRTRYADSLTKDQLSVINSMRAILLNVSNEIYSNIHFDENSLFESISNAFSLDTNQLLSGVSIGTEKDTINFDSLLSSESLTGLQVSLSSATRYALEYSTSQTAKLSNRSSSSISIDNNINPNLANNNSWQELYNTELQDVRFQKVSDPAEIAEKLKGADIGIPANVVTPSLAKELLNLGVNVFLEDYTAKFYGKDYIDNLINGLEAIDDKGSAKKTLLSDAVVYQGPVSDYSNSTLDAPVFDAYIEQGVADAIEYEKLLEKTAMIEQEVNDYGTRSQEEADPFYVPADFTPTDNRQDAKDVFY